MKTMIPLIIVAIVAAHALHGQPQDLVPVAVKVNTTPSPGGYYLAPNCRLTSPPYAPYFMVLGNDGVPVQWKKLEEYPFDSRVLPDGRLGYSVFQTAGTGPRISTTLHRLDSNLAHVDTLVGGNGYPVAMHNFDVLPNGNRLIICQENIRMDMSTIVDGGHPAADVQQMLVQEVTPQGQVMFQFRTLDRLPITASYEDLKAASIRPFHLNAVAEDDDGNFLMSIRHSSMIIKVNRKTGEVMWILGGKLNQFKFINEHEENAPTYFSYQHDVRRLPNGNVTLFDNGTQRSPQYSRGVEYKIDEVNKTCELVWEYRHNPDIYASLQGSMQTLPDGHRVIAWGSGTSSGIASFTEVDAAKNVVFEAFLHKDMFPYSVTKHAVPSGRFAEKVFIDEILQGNTYEYNKDDGDSIGMTVEYTSLVSFFYNYTEAKLYNYAPRDPVFNGGVYPRLLPVHIAMVQEGMESHYGQFRFKIDPIGITQKQAPSISVYRRDSVGRGTFLRQRTRYNPNSREIIVDSMSIGEFAFGIERDTIKDAQPPKLISPRAGKRVGFGVPITLRFSPQGLANSHTVSVTREGEPAVVFEETTTRDKATFTAQSTGIHLWMVESKYAPTGTVTAASAVDTFVVTEPFVEFKRPSNNVVWTKDSSYAISWETNIPGTVAIELINADTLVATIAQNIDASYGGFLWRIPVSVPVGDGYVIRIRVTPESGEGRSEVSAFTVTIKEQTVSVNDNMVTLRSSVAPNPATSIVYIGGDEPISSIAVFDAVGVLVATIPVSGTGARIDTSVFSQGTYHLMLQKGNHAEHHTLVIRR
ncbi:MAG: T9SS type A sorting domain-containing protein [Candidatus Kapabacteria bacterium]|nr:T9SS type A sorting domain-containing protein [Candidatus Kapabacteria bacterium]